MRWSCSAGSGDDVGSGVWEDEEEQEEQGVDADEAEQAKGGQIAGGTAAGKKRSRSEVDTEAFGWTQIEVLTAAHQWAELQYGSFCRNFPLIRAVKTELLRKSRLRSWLKARPANTPGYDAAHSRRTIQYSTDSTTAVFEHIEVKSIPRGGHHCASTQSARCTTYTTQTSSTRKPHRWSEQTRRNATATVATLLIR